MRRTSAHKRLIEVLQHPRADRLSLVLEPLGHFPLGDARRSAQHIDRSKHPHHLGHHTFPVLHLESARGAIRQVRASGTPLPGKLRPGRFFDRERKTFSRRDRSCRPRMVQDALRLHTNLCRRISYNWGELFSKTLRVDRPFGVFGLGVAPILAEGANGLPELDLLESAMAASTLRITEVSEGGSALSAG